MTLNFCFIKELNYDRNKSKVYEFDNVKNLDIYKKQEMFDQLLNSENVLFDEKTA